MIYVKKKKGWEIPESQATLEELYHNRRDFIKKVGLGAVGAYSMLNSLNGFTTAEASTSEGLYPAPLDEKYALDRPMTEEIYATRYNNYYEFTTKKDMVWKVAKDFEINPWKIQIKGLVKKPITIDFDEMVRKFPLEERLYRFRCVERWAMAVPWTGFPLRKLIEWAEPLSSAKYVRFVSFFAPDKAPGQKSQHWYPWPYFEALTMEKAVNELAIVVTGIYGKPIPPQNGAPLRIIVPWKYGYKNPKAIQIIEFVESQPDTFWHKLFPDEYSFLSNVNPNVPHPRWSQRKEKMIGTQKEYDTSIYNGYGDYVAHMYQ